METAGRREPRGAGERRKLPGRSAEVLRQQVQLLYDNGIVVLFANLVGAGRVGRSELNR